MEVLSYKTYEKATQALICRLQNRKVSLDEKHIVIVPDIYTLEFEKMIFLQNQGSFDVEVMTLSRLYQKLCSNSLEVLDKTGAVMLIKKILSTSDELEILKNKENKIGFCTTLYDIITKLYASNIAPLDLINQGSDKIREIGLIYQKYDNLTKNVYIDSVGKMRALAQLKNNVFFKNAHVYICNFDTFSSVQQQILQCINDTSLSMHIFTAENITTKTISANIFKIPCENDIQQYKFIAKDIYNKVVTGARFSDFIVVTANGDYDKINRVFSEMDIPFYMDKKFPFAQYQLVKFIEACLELYDNFNRFNVKVLIKNIYMGMDKSDIDDFTSYIDYFLIDYDRFFHTFTLSDGFDVEKMENIRKKIIDIVYPFIQDINNCTNAQMFTCAINNLVSRVDTDCIDQRIEQLSTVELKDFPDILKKLLEQLEGVFEDNFDIKDCISLFREGVNAINVNLIPPRSDEVVIGTPQLFRGLKKKFAYFAGFNEGVLPVVNDDISLVLDDDIDKLSKANISYEPKVSELNFRCRDEVWQIFHACDNIFISYLVSDTLKPSFDLYLLEKYNHVTEYKNDKELVFYEDLDDETRLDFLCNKSQAIEFLLTNKEADGVKVRNDCSVIFSLLRQEVLPFFTQNVGEFIYSAPEVFFPDNTTSISAIQTYFKCPFMYFLRYGLKLKEKPKQEVVPIDIGNILHEVAQKYILYNTPPQKIIKNILAKDKYSKVNDKLAKRLEDESVYLCDVLKYQLNKGDFKVFGAEIAFSPDSKLKSINVNGVNVIGKIDRVDCYDNYARVIDYKTGNTTFSYKDFYQGKLIQLPVYLAVMRQNGYTPGGAFYLPLVWNKTAGKEKNRMDGLCLFDDKLYEKMDNALIEENFTGQYLSSDIMKCTIRKTKQGIGPTGKKLLSSKNFNNILRYSKDILASGVEHIYKGHMPVSPCSGACDYCEYRPICKFNTTTDQIRQDYKNIDNKTFDNIYGEDTNEQY